MVRRETILHTDMADCVLELLDKSFLAAWLLELAQVESDEFGPVHCRDVSLGERICGV